MLAYSSLSHVGLVVLGIASLNLQGIQGALFQLLDFTMVAGGLFLLSGLLHHRLGSTDTISLGGAAKSMPLLAAFFLLFGFAGMGVPGTNGFPPNFSSCSAPSALIPVPAWPPSSAWRRAPPTSSASTARPSSDPSPPRWWRMPRT
jgi:NADH:ubiquinone oxidoreductase subunit 4 (subunit M)